MTESPHALLVPAFTAASETCQGINLPLPDLSVFRGKSADAVMEEVARIQLDINKTAEMASAASQIAQDQADADDTLTRNPSPAAVKALEDRAELVEGYAPGTQNATRARALADDATTKRNQAVSVHGTRSSESRTAFENLSAEPSVPQSHVGGAGGGAGSGNGSGGGGQIGGSNDGPQTGGTGDPVNPSGPGSTSGSGDPSSPSGPSASEGGTDGTSLDPSKAGTQLSGDNAAGQNPSALQGGQGQGSGAQPGGGLGTPWNPAAGSMLGGGAKLPKDDKKKRNIDPDVEAKLGNAAAAGAGVGAGLAAGVGSSVSGVTTGANITGRGINEPTNPGVKLPPAGSPAGVQRGMGGGGGMGGMGGGPSGGKTRKAEGEPSKFGDKDLLGWKTTEGAVQGPVIGRSNADPRNFAAETGTYSLFEEEPRPEDDRK